MKIPLTGKYDTAALVLLAAAALLIGTAYLTNRGDITTAAVVIAGMVCLLTGIFLFILSGGEPIDPRMVGLLPVQGCINLCRVASDLGIHGSACFLPPRLTGSDRVMQFIPVSTYDG